ncbi:MAG TPA: sulfite exporter TauE/SafE family protein [Phycisphaerae bacterium]|nr:sulfite exporter TauE/SafE family protein [Phycisphaerae bacterium]
MLDGPTILALLGVGLLGGFLGGFLGIGGSVLFIPMLTLFMKSDYHTAQAAAMVVNVCVGFSASQSHIRSGLVSRRLLTILVPCAMAASIVGVYLSNQFTGDAEVYLRRIFGAVMIYVIAANLHRMARRRWPHAWGHRPRRKPSRGAAAIGLVGGVMGLSTGLLGLGGGSVAVPAQQVLLGMRLRTAVANSSVAIIFSGLLAAGLKHATLPAGVDPARPWVYVGLLVPTAIIGAAAGAYSSRRVAREWVRLVLVVFLGWTALKMLTA